ncbi:MAG: hypothetical protein A2Y12_01650 [Planctomycetes bacterium GWF2_42_9]|nr:MAG: hypothetical protein A2Y12_01650 [Planctomycetes bacterium GWF2_42_9]
MKTCTSFKDKLKRIFRLQAFAVLATQQKKMPYTSLVAFACSDDMRCIVFATLKATRKFANIMSNPNVSMFIDNRSNNAADFSKAIGITALGSVRQLTKNKNSKMMKLYLKKHPQLKPFLASPSCAFICMDVKSFYVVERFQNVTEINLK